MWCCPSRRSYSEGLSTNAGAIERYAPRLLRPKPGARTIRRTSSPPAAGLWSVIERRTSTHVFNESAKAGTQGLRLFIPRCPGRLMGRVIRRASTTSVTACPCAPGNGPMRSVDRRLVATTTRPAKKEGGLVATTGRSPSVARLRRWPCGPPRDAGYVRTGGHHNRLAP
jgi:hypothetical protein